MQTPAPNKPAPRRLRRLLGWAAAGALALVALPLLLAVGLRLYYDDARVGGLARQALQDRLGAQVSLGGLRMAVGDGIELSQLHIGPLPGFTHDTLHIERLAVHWQAGALLRGAVVLPEVACTGVRVALEENAQAGANWEAIARALKGAEEPAQPAPPEPHEPKAQAPPKPPRLPVPVRVERLELALDEAVVDRPHQRARLAHAQVVGSLAGEGEALEAKLWAGLGDPNGAVPSTLHVETDAPSGSPSGLPAGSPQQALDVTQTLGVALDTTGFGDLRVAVDWQADAHGQAAGRALAPMRLDATVRTEANLLGGTARVSRCQLRVGTTQGTAASLDGAAAASQLFGTPELDLQQLQGEARLDALQPLLAPWLPGLELGGVARLHLAPLQASVPALQGWSALAAAVELVTEQVSVRRGPLSATGLDSQTQLRTHDGAAEVRTQVALARAAQGETVAQGLQLDLTASTPLAPWLGGEAAGSVPVGVTVRLARAEGPGFAAQDTAVEVRAEAPIALLRRAPAPGPLQATVHGSHARAGAGANALQGLRYTAQLSAWDLAGERADAKVHVQARRADAGELRIPDLAVHLDAQRRGDDLLLRGLEVTAAKDWRFTAEGAVEAATSPAPRFRAVRAAVAPLSLGQAIATLPPAMRPAGTFAGTFGLTASLQGTVPYRELLAHSRPPPLPGPDDPAWSRGLQAAADWLQGWVDRLDDGLPFTAGVRLELKDVDVDMPQGAERLQLAGLRLVQDLQLRPHGPVVALDVNLPHLGGATPAQGLLFHLDAQIDSGDVALRTDTKVAQVDLAGQATPLQDLRCSAALDYSWGGDLRLHDVLLVAANRGVKLTASGLVAQPMDVAMSRAWERAGLPGVEARFAWDLGVNAPHEERLNQAGMTFSGTLDVNGEVRLAAGELALAGELRADQVHAESGTTLVEQMNGALPFDVRWVFGTRADATPVRRGLGFGGGVLSLVTADEDVRNRPARPVYYDRLRPYRPAVGLRALRVQSGPYEVVDFSLEGRITEGMLLADWISMHVLGGDVVGNLALQLGRDDAVRGDLAFKVSNVDASYLPVLSLRPGPDSELSADLRVSFLAGEQGRDLSANMNVTKIGAKALDRFLQLLDPEAKDAKLQDTRKNLRFVRIQQVAVWMRYENLNMDLSYDPILAIPFTQIGYRPIERELLRRYALGEFLDLYMQPYIDTKLAPALGWNHGHS